MDARSVAMGDGVVDRPGGTMTIRSKRAVKAAFGGWVVDYYDISLPTVALAPAFAYFVPDDLPATAQTTIFFLTFAVTLLARPIGSVIFGSFADRIGRRRGTLVSVGGFSVATLLMAALPGYAAMGYGGLALLLALRFVGGIFMGGEYTSANPLALESTPKHLRGLVGGVIGSAYPIGNILISVFTAALLAWLPASEAYTQWGWRIPFLIGAVMGFAFFLYRRRLEESPLFERATHGDAEQYTSSRPVRDLFSGANLRNFLQVFFLMTGLWLAVLMLTSATPGLLTQFFDIPGSTVTQGILLANIVLALGYISAGLLGQRFGRRAVISVVSVGMMTVGAAVYVLMINNLRSGGSFVTTMVLYTVVLVLALSPFGIVTTYIIERFATQVRASGYGIGYTFAIVVPSFFSFFMVWLGSLMPYEFTPVVFIVLGGALALVGVRLGPETRDVDL